MSDCDKAKQLLTDDLSCVLVKGDMIYKSSRPGIAPMIEFIDNKTDLTGFSIADKIVGKAVSLLFIYAHIKEVFAKTISKPAFEILEKHSIKVSYDVMTERIINRKGTGLCPMEETVLDIEDPETALTLLRQKVQQLKAMNTQQQSN